MKSSIPSQYIYGSCREHNTQLIYIGKTSLGRPICQCPICKEKMIVPREWVRGLSMVADMGLSKIEKEELERKRIDKNIPDIRCGAGRIK